MGQEINQSDRPAVSGINRTGIPAWFAEKGEYAN